MVIDKLDRIYYYIHNHSEHKTILQLIKHSFNFKINITPVHG